MTTLISRVKGYRGRMVSVVQVLHYNYILSSSLIYSGGVDDIDGQTVIAESPRGPLPPVPIHDKTYDSCDGHCDKSVDGSDNLLDELFG